jgi:hypothetical protein
VQKPYYLKIERIVSIMMVIDSGFKEGVLHSGKLTDPFATVSGMLVVRNHFSILLDDV